MTDLYGLLGGGSDALGRAIVAFYAALIGLIAIGQACAAGMAAQHNRRIR